MVQQADQDDLHQIVFHGIMLPYPGVYTFLSDVRAECSFDPDSIFFDDDAPGIESALAHWLFSIFSMPDIYNLGPPMWRTGLLKLHNIPAPIFRAEDRPKDKEEANRLARSTIERLMDGHFAGRHDPVLVKWIMQRIELVERKEPEEYPVSKPRPVGLSLSSIVLSTDVLGDLAGCVDSR
jgi:hypothetical protein